MAGHRYRGSLSPPRHDKGLGPGGLQGDAIYKPDWYLFRANRLVAFDQYFSVDCYHGNIAVITTVKYGIDH